MTSISVRPNRASKARHRAAGKLWRIAIAAEMAEHNAFDFSRQKLFDDRRSRGV